MIHIHGNGSHARVVRDILRFRPRVEHSEMAIVAVGNNWTRKREAQRLEDDGYKFATAVSQYAIISQNAEYGAGTVICEGAIIQCGVRIGKHCIINCGAVITHDCVIGDYVHIAPGAHLCGAVEIGEGTLVGVGVGIEPGVKIPAWSIVKRKGYTIGALRRN